jgi:hypothetical protein
LAQHRDALVELCGRGPAERRADAAGRHPHRSGERLEDRHVVEPAGDVTAPELLRDLDDGADVLRRRFMLAGKRRLDKPAAMGCSALCANTGCDEPMRRSGRRPGKAMRPKRKISSNEVATGSRSPTRSTIAAKLLKLSDVSWTAQTCSIGSSGSTIGGVR